MTEGSMNKVRLGRTDLMVTSICFGTSGIGDMPDTYGYGVDEARARATMHAIFDGPANFIDTSRIYGMGRSEERIGAAIRDRGGLPEGFVVSTKLDRDPETNRFDAAQARRSLEQSLKALGLERVDLLHLHDPEHTSSVDETLSRDGALGELFRMKEEGLARAIGLAAGVVSTMIPLLRDWDFDVLITHNRFTLANRNADAMLDLAASRGIAVLNAALTPAACSPRDRPPIRATPIRKLRRKCSIRSGGSKRSACCMACRPERRRCSSPCAIPGSPRPSAA